MVPALLFDISRIDMNQLAFDAAAIEKINPHRGDMRMIDGVIWSTPTFDQAVAYKDIRQNEFWAAGHIPGRPIFPGVLQIEAGAQLASFMFLQRLKGVKFMGFAGVEDVKFRGMVKPGDRLLIIGIEIELRPRRSICAVQGLVNGTLVFEARIIGMPM